MKGETSTTKFKKELMDKDREMEEINRKNKKERQKLILECHEREDAKDLRLRQKGLEHGQKLMEKDLEIKEIIK